MLEQDPHINRSEERAHQLVKATEKDRYLQQHEHVVSTGGIPGAVLFSIFNPRF
jgi:hypothetical protein